MKMTINGKLCKVQGVDFEIGREEWNEYKLLDGGVIRVKLVVTRIYQVLDEDGKPVPNQDGSLQYGVQSQVMLVA